MTTTKKTGPKFQNLGGGVYRVTGVARKNAVTGKFTKGKSAATSTATKSTGSK